MLDVAELTKKYKANLKKHNSFRLELGKQFQLPAERWQPLFDRYAASNWGRLRVIKGRPRTLKPAIKQDKYFMYAKIFDGCIEKNIQLEKLIILMSFPGVDVEFVDLFYANQIRSLADAENENMYELNIKPSPKVTESDQAKQKNVSSGSEQEPKYDFLNFCCDGRSMMDANICPFG